MGTDSCGDFSAAAGQGFGQVGSGGKKKGERPGPEGGESGKVAGRAFVGAGHEMQLIEAAENDGQRHGQGTLLAPEHAQNGFGIVGTAADAEKGFRGVEDDAASVQTTGRFLKSKNHACLHGRK